MCFKRHFSILLLLILIGNLLNGQTQNRCFEHFSVEDGLSQSLVHSICQDTLGFIWIATDDGLNRFDGHNIVVYKNDVNDKHSIVGNVILTLFEDSKANLWVGTEHGLCLYDRHKDCFIHQPYWPNRVIISLAEDDEENLWIGMDFDLYCYNLNTAKFTVFDNRFTFDGDLSNSDAIYTRAFSDKENIDDKRSIEIYIDSKNNAWIGTLGGLLFFDKNTKNKIKYKHDDKNPRSINSNSIYCILEDSKGRIWIGTDKGLNLFLNAGEHPQNGIFIRYQNNINDESSLTPGSITDLLEDDQHNLWIASENKGINILDLNTFTVDNCKFGHTSNVPGNTNSLNNNGVNSLFQDKHHNIWIGTFSGGINFFSKYAKKFTLVKNDPQNKNSLSNNQVNVFFEDNNFLWIGTEEGLNRYNKNDGTFKHFVNKPSDKTSIGSNSVWAVYKDRSASFWVGTWAGGLNKFDYKTETFTHYYFNPKDTFSLSNNNIFSILEDSKGNFWIGTMGGGLNLFDRDNNIFYSYNDKDLNIYTNYVESIVETKKGELWLANVTSLELFDRINKRAQHFRHDANDSLSLLGNKIYAIFEDSKENLWIGTDEGLNLFDRAINGFKCYQTTDGLPDNSVKSILEDNHGNLWIGTNKGLSKFNGAIDIPDQPIFRNYTPEDGLQGYEFNRRSCLKSSDGIMYFGGINGFNEFYPDSLANNPYAPDVVITDFLLFNEPVKIGGPNSPLSQNINITKFITLNHTHSVISFRFSALNYILPLKNQYAYIMEGFEQKWNYVGNKSEATYTNLDPGEYTFRVKASNNDGLWNEEGTSINIKILPPWWGTWLFLLILGLCIFILLSYFLYRMIRKIRNQANQTILDERNQLKTMINNIPDHIFIKDTKSRFLILNNNTVKYLKGKSEKDFLYKTDFDLYPKEMAENFFREEQEVISSGIPIINEENSRNINGQVMVISTTKCPIINTKGETIGLIGIIRDITAQKMAQIEIEKKGEELKNYNILLNEKNLLLEEKQEEITMQNEELEKHRNNLEHLVEERTSELVEAKIKAEESDKLKSSFLTNLSHEIRTPMNAIYGFSQLLDDDSILKEDQSTYIKIIGDNCESLLVLISDIMDISRIEAEEIVFINEKIYADDILLDLENFYKLKTEKKIDFEFVNKTTKNGLILNIDKLRFRQVFMNLLDNAYKFSDSGHIKFGYDVFENNVRFFVSDTGIGIELTEFDKIFNHFYKIEMNPNKLYKGTGLGLAICKKVIEKMGGEIWVESVVNQGSVFYFTLP